MKLLLSEEGRNSETCYSDINCVDFDFFPNYCNLPKIQTKRSNLRVFCQKDANRIANSEDPDQTAPKGAV